jgi:LacI family transcriptional regulator
VALFYGNPSASYLSEVILGSLDETHRHDAQLQLDRWADDDDEQGVGNLVSRRIDAAILPPPFGERPGLVAALNAAGIAVGVLAAASASNTAFTVSIDDRAATLEMTRYLLNLGHRRIGFVTGTSDQSASAERLAGYREALAAAGIPADDVLVAEGAFTYASGLAAGERLLHLANRPTAIFASNDDMAAGVAAAAHRRHFEIPVDLSLCGFDDTALATSISPELTTVRQPIAEMTRTLVSQVIDAVHRRRRGLRVEPTRTIVAPELVQRGSHATPLA